MNSLIFLFSLMLISSCGKSVKDKTEKEVPEEETTDGTYSAFLLPMNSLVSSHVSGEVKVEKYGDDFRVDVKLEDSPGGLHKQYLQTGTSCKDVGSRLVPFDDDLSGQMRGYAHFPSGDYHYKRSTSYYLMLADLHLPDDTTEDNLVKLLSWDLPLEKRAVTIYSKTSDGDQLMACGVLTKISTSETPETGHRTPRRPRGPDDNDHVDPRPRPRPRPHPAPSPEPTPQPRPDPDDNMTWWERLREGWRHWRDRVIGHGP